MHNIYVFNLFIDPYKYKCLSNCGKQMRILHITAFFIKFADFVLNEIQWQLYIHFKFYVAFTGSSKVCERKYFSLFYGSGMYSSMGVWNAFMPFFPTVLVCNE